MRRRLLGVLLLLLLTQTYQLTDNDTAKTNSTDSTTNLTNATTEDYVTVTTEDSIERTMPLLEDIAPGGGYEKMEHRVSLGQEAVVPDADFYSVERREIEDAVDYGLRKMHELVLVKEPELYRKGLWLDHNNPAMHVAAFSAPSEQALKLARYGYASLQAATKLAKRHGQWGRNNPELRESFRDTLLHTDCPLRGRPRCRPAARRYRTADGTCNNFEHPWRGAANTPQQRFLTPRYEDGLQTVRRSVLGGALPSPRVLSTGVHGDQDVEMPAVTLMLMQWGQFVDHDITASAMGRGFNGSVPLCCENGGTGFQRPEFTHPDCLPIPVPPDDWFFSRLGIRCLEFVRSAPTSRIDCDLGWREQINQVTSFVDASQIYGNSAPQADSQRTFRGGRIQNHRLDNQNPPDPPAGDICTDGAITARCFRPGDGRASEQPALTSFHIIWVRKHNQLANLLERANPHWSDEKIYQETRRIVAATMQHITYREFLPIVLGQEVMTLFDLDLLPKGYYAGYDPTVNPSAANSFTAAAFRFGHSLVQRSFVRFDPFHRPLFNNVTLHEEQSNHENIWSRGSVDRLLLGLSNQAAQRRDEFITRELTNHLFQPPGFPFGMDLAAINIQRGRDHGIPPYTAWRKPCGLSAIKNWEDIERVTSLETATRFRSVYASVDDIDLYTGGLAEKPVRGGLVGPTFACIIAQQFSNLRKGDRFWYENGNFENSFTPAQLQQIRKVSFAEVVCDTMPEVETIQPFVFMASSVVGNKRKSCGSLRSFKVDAWVENFRRGKKVAKRSVNSIPFIEVLNLNDRKDDSDDPDDEETDRSASSKRKKQTRRKKPSRKTSSTTVRSRVKVKRLSTPAPNDYYAEYHYQLDHLPAPPTFRPVTQRPVIHTSARPPGSDEISILVPAQHPEDLNYLINTVTKRPVSKTTKPDYNIHIQINYYLNSTGKPDLDDPAFDNPNLPYLPGQFVQQTGYGGSSTTARPISTTRRPAMKRPYSTTKRPTGYYSTTKRPYYSTSTSYYSTTKRPYYSSTTTYYSSTKRPYYSTKRPTTTKKPYFITNTNPLSVVYPGPSQFTTKRPSVVILGEESDYPRPYPYRPDYYRPYDYQTSYEAKRPSIVSHVIKLDQPPTPLPPYAPDHSFELPHKIYYINNNPPNLNPIDLTKIDLDDKINLQLYPNFQPNKNYIQVTTVTNQRPYEDEDKRFVKISSVRGHTTSTKNLGPVFVSVQQKDGDDLELNYSDIYEMFSKPDNGTGPVDDASNVKWKIFNATDEDPQPVLPTLRCENETSEQPKPIHELIGEFDDLII